MRLFNLPKIVFACLACLLMGGLANAQGVGASGDITGTVSDPSSAVIANATVTVTDVEKGTKRTVTTGNAGEYRALSLLPSTYSVSVAKTGFQTEIAKNVVVTIGQTTVVDFHMKLSTVSEAVEVTTEPPVVETDRGHQANVIDQQFIQDLPINRRDYLTFTLLAPGVSNSTQLASNSDFRVKQTPQSGLSFYGSNGRGNSVTVDGGEANDDSGGVRLTLSQDAVQEFQVNRTNYGADLGGASGASINIVSKSGTNNLHGTAYGFFRNDAMDARNPFAVTQALQPGQVFNPLQPDVHGVATKDSLTREQFGFSIGGPITKDKTWLMISFEGLVQDAQNAVPLLTNTSIFRPQSSPLNNQQAIINDLLLQPAQPVPCITGGFAIPSAVCAQIMTNALTISPTTGLTPGQTAINKYLVNQFESNGGLFSFNTREYLASARLDHTFSEQNNVRLRYSFAHDREENPDVQALTGFSAGSTIHALDHTIQGAWFHQFNANTLNEARVQWNYTNFDVIPNSPGQAGLTISGFGTLGTNIFLPSLTIMRRPEVADNITMTRGSHTMKFGGYFLYRGNHTESHTFFPGRFQFGALPGGIIFPCLQVPIVCSGPNPNNPLLTAPSAQLDALQAASFGLPQFYQQGFGSAIYNYPRPFTSAYWQDSWAMRPNFTFTYGLRYELDSQYGPLSTYKKNFAPRASFAWDPFKDHKTAIRAGFGIYYSPIYGQIADVVQTLGLVNGFQQIAQVFVPLTGVPGSPPSLTSALIFQTLFGQGKVQCTTPAAGNAACITAADLTQFGIAIKHDGTAPLSVFFSGQSAYRNPYAEQGSLGIEREIAPGFSVSVSGIYVHTLHLPVAIDKNVLPTAPFTTVPFGNGQTVSVQNWNNRVPNPLGPAPCAGVAIVTCFAKPLVLQDNVYSSAASALYYGGILEVKKRFANHVSLIGNYTYSKSTDTSTDFNSDFGPASQVSLAGERANSDFDQRHKVTMAGVFDSPGHGFLSGFQLAPIVRYNSGHPFNFLFGGDVNGDRHSTNDRPIGLGRNAGQGPDFLDVDLRLTKAFKVAERNQLQFTAEAFNLGNRTNFGSVNNVFPGLGGLLEGNFSGQFIDPSTQVVGGVPRAFTAGAGSFARRQLQFGARWVF
jgi:hypothetical protein